MVGNPEALARLEALVHPLVAAEKARWLAAQAAAGQGLVVLDIPLLFETGAQAECDAVAVVSAPADVQRARALARPGMTEAKLAGLLARQVPDAERRRRADFVIDTVGGWVGVVGVGAAGAGTICARAAGVAWRKRRWRPPPRPRPRFAERGARGDAAARGGNGGRAARQAGYPVQRHRGRWLSH